MRTKEVIRRAAVVLHQHGIELTPTEIRLAPENAFSLIRSVLKAECKLLPKSDLDVIRWLQGLKEVKVKR